MFRILVLEANGRSNIFCLKEHDYTLLVACFDEADVLGRVGIGTSLLRITLKGVFLLICEPAYFWLELRAQQVNKNLTGVKNHN